MSELSKAERCGASEQSERCERTNVASDRVARSKRGCLTRNAPLLQIKDTFPSVEALYDGNLVLRLLVLRQLVSSKGRGVQTFFQYFPYHAKDLLALLIPKFEFPKPQNLKTQMTKATKASSSLLGFLG